MKRFLHIFSSAFLLTFVLLILMTGGTAQAATSYYVSPTGSDTNAGTLGAPKKTLAAGFALLNAGDTLYLRAGTYRETLTATKSGTSSAPITIAAYNNENVTISACDVIAGPWTSTGNGIYVANVGWDLGESYNQVFVDGVMQREAQYPNDSPNNSVMNHAAADVTVASNYTITSTGFGALGDLTGARFLGGVGDCWQWQAGVIISSSGNTVTVNTTTAGIMTSIPWWPNTKNVASSTGKGFVYGKLSLLDADGEWFLNTGGSQLSLRITGGVDPTGHQVEVKRRNWCVDFGSRNYVTIQGVATRAGAINVSGSNDALKNCDLGYLSHFLYFDNGYLYNGNRSEGGGVQITGSSNTVTGCQIHDTAGCGIYVFSTGNTNQITRNHLYNIDYSGTNACPIKLNGTGNVVRFNTAHHSGRDVIVAGGFGNDIRYNDCYQPGQMALDLGVIYTFATDAKGTAASATRIAYNWFHDNQVSQHGPAIYLDNFCRNFLVDHNVCWNTQLDTVVRLNGPRDGHLIYNNTFFNCVDANTSTSNRKLTDAANPDPTFFNATNAPYFHVTLTNNLYLSHAPQIQLTDWANSDFHLIPNAVAIDAGVPIAGITDGYAGSAPDLGAYESGGPYWKPGITGWPIEQPAMRSDYAGNFSGGNATLFGTLISAGLPSATVEVFWGTSDGGTTPANWSHKLTVGSGYTGSFISLNKSISGVVAGTSYVFRFHATNANGESWGDAQTFDAVPVNVTWDADTGNTGAQDGSGVWNQANTTWWSGSANITFMNGVGVTFGSANGAAGLVTISGINPAVSQLTFNPAGSGQYVISRSANETLAILNGTITTNADATISAPLVGGAVNLTKAGTGTLTLAGAGTYTGGTTIRTGTIVASTNGALGSGTITLVDSQSGIGDSVALVTSGAVTLANNLNAYLWSDVNGVTTVGGTTAHSSTFSGTVKMDKGVTMTAALGGTVTFSGTMSQAYVAGAGITKIGAGTVVLANANTCTGPIAISAGSLVLGSAGSITNASSLSIAAGATWDVSAIANYTVSSSTTLSASGVGATLGTTAATITGGSSVDLGSQPIALTFTPSASTGDTAHPSLCVSAGTLLFNNNAFTINNAASSALDVGIYRLIQLTGGSVSGALAGSTISVTGAGLVPGTTAVMSITVDGVNLVVSGPAKTIPTITWTTPVDITYGIALSAAQLNATSSVPGTFLYTPAIGTILSAGDNQTLSIQFTPDDGTQYAVTTKAVTINVLKQVPTITWATPTTITYGTALDGMQLNAASSIPGTLIYTPSAGTILNAGTDQTLGVSFIPTDVNFTSVPLSVKINVLKHPLTITATDMSRVAGQANPMFAATYSGLVNGDTSASIAVPVSFACSATVASPAGTYDITPSGAAATTNYSITYQAGTLTVTDVPIITAQVVLSGLAQTYTGTARTVGVSTTPPNLSVAVTYDGNPTPPTEPGSYAIVATVTTAGYVGSASGTLTVAKATQAITFNAIGDQVLGVGSIALVAKASSNLLITFSVISGPGTISASSLTLTGAGSLTVAADQAGDAHYQTAPQIIQIITVTSAPVKPDTSSGGGGGGCGVGSGMAGFAALCFLMINVWLRSRRRQA